MRKTQSGGVNRTTAISVDLNSGVEPLKDRIEYTARKATVAPPPRYSADHIRALRKDLGLSQPVFAGMLNVSGSTVRAWEQGQRQPEGPTLRLLEVAERHPEALMSNMTPTTRTGARGRDR